MILTSFIESLLHAGSVTIPGEMTVFPQDDLHASVKLLQHYYEEDKLEMPYEAPGFAPDAAIWSARYLFHAIQLAMLRDMGEAVVEQFLQPYSGKVIPETVYSADLVLRYLPDLFYLAKGLAPEDILVKKIKATALAWPFSAVGITLDTEPDLGVILGHDSLREAYTDRIIAGKDKESARNELMSNYILTAIGEHRDKLWPEFEPFDLTKKHTDNETNNNGNDNGAPDNII